VKGNVAPVPNEDADDFQLNNRNVVLNFGDKGEEEDNEPPKEQ